MRTEILHGQSVEHEGLVYYPRNVERRGRRYHASINGIWHRVYWTGEDETWSTNLTRSTGDPFDYDDDEIAH